MTGHVWFRGEVSIEVVLFRGVLLYIILHLKHQKGQLVDNLLRFKLNIFTEWSLLQLANCNQSLAGPTFDPPRSLSWIPAWPTQGRNFNLFTVRWWAWLRVGLRKHLYMIGRELRIQSSYCPDGFKFRTSGNFEICDAFFLISTTFLSKTSGNVRICCALIGFPQHGNSNDEQSSNIVTTNSTVMFCY